MADIQVQAEGPHRCGRAFSGPQGRVLESESPRPSLGVNSGRPRFPEGESGQRARVIALLRFSVS